MSVYTVCFGYIMRYAHVYLSILKGINKEKTAAYKHISYECGNWRALVSTYMTGVEYIFIECVSTDVLQENIISV